MIFLLSLANGDFDVRVPPRTFVASPTGGQLCVNITLIGDMRYEGDEQFLVRFTNVPDAMNRVGLGMIPQACVTILDNDG